MFWKKNRNIYPINSYKNALHVLLEGEPQGLSSSDIAKALKISNAECEKLLYQEQLSESLSVDPYSGTLIYRSNLDIQNCSLDQELEIARRNYLLNRVKSMKIFALKTVVTIVAINLTINFPEAEPRKRESVQDYNLEFSYKVDNNNLDSKAEELIKLDKILKSGATRENCSLEWNNNNDCYIDNRFYSEEEFYKKINLIENYIQENK